MPNASRLQQALEHVVTSGRALLDSYQEDMDCMRCEDCDHCQFVASIYEAEKALAEIKGSAGSTDSKELEIISDADVVRVHQNANFGSVSKRDVVRFGVLKCASGYHQGHTSKIICIEHGLIRASSYRLTKKGGEYLWAAFSQRGELEATHL